MLSIIQAHILPGTVVHSDQWSAYSQVASLQNVASHSTVNHLVEFVNPTTGVHIQHVESYRNRCKSRFKAMKGCHESQLPSYLDELMWRECPRSTANIALNSFIQDIADQYPV